MDEKNLHAKNGSSHSDSNERKYEDIGDTLSSNSFEPTLNNKCVFEASVAEDCFINNENSNTPSDEIGEKVCIASYAEMAKFNRINAYEKSSLGSENVISTRSPAFKEYREQSGYSDDSATGSSTANVSGEEEALSPRTLERNFFINKLKNDTCIDSFLYHCYKYGKNATNPYAGVIQTWPSTQQIGKNMQNSDALRCNFDSLERYNEIIAANQPPIITQSETYKGEFASLPNTANPIPRFLYSYVNPCDTLKIKAIEVGSNGTLNPLENFSNIKSSLNDIIRDVEMQLSDTPSDMLSFSVYRSSNESDISDEPKKILKNNSTILTDMRAIEPCPKLSPIEDENGKEKSLNNILDVMTYSELPNNDENMRRNDSSLNNREGISPTLDASSMNKENYLNETDVSQYKTFKRSRSYSPTSERESKIRKPSSPTEWPTRTLRNVDINLMKRSASPDDNLSPECHNMMQVVKKQKIK